MRFLFKALPERAQLPALGKIEQAVGAFLQQNPDATVEQMDQLRRQLAGGTKWESRYQPVSLPTLRRMTELGLPFKDWYHEAADTIAQHFGEDKLKEALALMGPTSQQASVPENLANTMRAMDLARQIDAQGQLQGPPDPANPGFAAFDAGLRGPLSHGKKIKIAGDAISKLWKFYTQGTVETGGQKTPSYTGNFERAHRREWDPLSTMDTWALKPFGFGERQEGRPGKTVRMGQRQLNGAVAGTPWYSTIQPTDKEYDFGRGVYQHLAAHYGLTPHQVQAAVWMTGQGLLNAVDAHPEWAGLAPDELVERAHAGGYLNPNPEDSKDTVIGAFHHPLTQMVLSELQARGALDAPSPGMSSQANYVATKLPSGKGREVPVEPGFRDQKRREALELGPQVRLPASQAPVDPTAAYQAVAQVLGALGYNPETRRLAALDKMNIDHYVHDEPVHVAGEEGLIPHAAIHTAGLNRNAARYLAAVLGTAGGLDGLHLSQHDAQAENHGGFVYDSPHEITPQQMVELHRQVGNNSSRLEMISPTQLHFPDVDGVGYDAQHQALTGALTGVGLDPQHLGGYYGYHEHVPAHEFPAILAEHGATYGPGGSLDIPLGAAAPLRGAYEPGGAEPPGPGAPVLGPAGPGSAPAPRLVGAARKSVFGFARGS